MQKIQTGSRLEAGKLGGKKNGSLRRRAAQLEEHFARGLLRLRYKAEGKDKGDRIDRIDDILLLQHFPDENAEGNALARR